MTDNYRSVQSSGLDSGAFQLAPRIVEMPFRPDRGCRDVLNHQDPSERPECFLNRAYMRAVVGIEQSTDRRLADTELPSERNVGQCTLAHGPMERDLGGRYRVERYGVVTSARWTRQRDLLAQLEVGAERRDQRVLRFCECLLDRVAASQRALVTIEGLQGTLPLEQPRAQAVPADGQIVFVAVSEPSPTYHITRGGVPVCGVALDPDQRTLRIEQNDADAAGITTLPLCNQCESLWAAQD